MKKLERLDIPDGVTKLYESAFEETTVLAAAPIRELLHPKPTIELSVTPGRDYSDMVTPAVMEPFTPELWDWLPDLLHCARHCGAAEMEAHLLALEEAGLAQGKNVSLSPRSS